MRFGIRRPSFNKSMAARFSVKRRVKNALGLRAPRGWGWVTNPKKASYNWVYNRTTISARKPAALVILVLAGLLVGAFKLLEILFTGLISLTKWGIGKYQERKEAQQEVPAPLTRVATPAIPRGYTEPHADFVSAEPVVTTPSDDELYDEAVSIVLQTNEASTTTLQRRLKIDYPRAARLIDDMEVRGVVGIADGNRPRKILLTRPMKKVN